MYEYIKGKLMEANPQQAIVEVNGLGYKLLLPLRLFTSLPSEGAEVLLYTSFQIKETTHALYGFLTRQERDLFELLMTVSGIGAKIALSLLGHLTAFELVQAVGCGNIALLSKVPGIGKKTAERLILEIKDKLPVVVPVSESVEVGKPVSLASDKIRDAMSALINLGYSQAVAQRAIKQTMDESDESIELAALITAALQRC